MLSQGVKTSKTDSVASSDGRISLPLESAVSKNGTADENNQDLSRFKAAILLLGGSVQNLDSQTKGRLLQLFSRGLGNSAASNDTIILDFGVDQEILRSLHQRLHALTGNSVILTGGSSELKLKQATEISKRFPVVALIVGDPAEERKETVLADILYAVRQGWLIEIISNSGYLTTEIETDNRNWQNYRDSVTRQIKDPSKPDFPLPAAPYVPNAKLAEIVEEGKFSFFSLQRTPQDLQQELNPKLRLRVDDELLKKAIIQRKIYSESASNHHLDFQIQQLVIIVLTVTITFLATIQTLYANISGDLMVQPLFFPFGFQVQALKDVLHLLLLILPIGLAIFVAGANLFNAGNKWLMLRAGSEAIKREMFYYRTNSGIYSDEEVDKNNTTREITFSNSLETIIKKWVEPSLDFGTLSQLRKEPTKLVKGVEDESQTQDTGLGYLLPEEYVQFRLQTQLDHYQKKVGNLEHQLVWCQWFILIFSGVAVLWTALNLELLITITTACATALTTYIGYNQTVSTLRQYNHAIMALTSHLNWWTALGSARSNPQNVKKLIDYTETILQSEQAGWVQQMQTALTELRSQQSKRGENDAQTEPLNTIQTNNNNTVEQDQGANKSTASKTQPVETTHPLAAPVDAHSQVDNNADDTSDVTTNPDNQVEFEENTGTPPDQAGISEKPAATSNNGNGQAKIQLITNSDELAEIKSPSIINSTGTGSNNN